MDDNYSSASPRPVEGLYESQSPEILVLKNGFWEEAGAYMDKLNKRFSYIEPDQSPFEMKKAPSVLFIPSGGLYGLDKSEQFRGILRDYVFRGNTVIISSQQHGYEYKALPGGEEIEAYGWQEDISCFYDSTYIDWWHPVFARIRDSKISIPVDGYFIRIPESSRVLLGRSANGMPELFYYPFGEGTVVASSSFDDYVNWTSGAPEIRRAVFRDLLTWALAPRLEMPEYNLRENPSPTVNLNVEVENLSEETASLVKIIWLTPDRKVIYEEEKIASISSGGKIGIPISYTLNNISETDYGIWHVDYVLYGQDSHEVQSQKEALSGRFSICLAPEDFVDAYELVVEIQLAQERVLWGTSAHFQVKISNLAEEAKRLRLYWGLELQQPATYWDEVEVKPANSITQDITVSLPFSLVGANNFWVHVFEKDSLRPYRSLRNIRYLPCQDLWPYVGSQKKSIVTVQPLVKVSVQTDKSYYRRGEEVKLRFAVRNEIAFSYPVEYMIEGWGKDTNGRTRRFFIEEGQIELDADKETILEKSFILGDEAAFGNCGAYIQLRYLKYRELWWYNACSFSLSSSGITYLPYFPSIFLYNQLNPVSFDLKCAGYFPVANGNLSLKLLSTSGETLYQETKPVSMAVGETKNISFSVPIAGLQVGTNRLEYSYADETGVAFSGSKPIDCQYQFSSIGFDKPHYEIGDTALLSVDWAGFGPVETDLGIEVALPDTSFVQTTTIHYSPSSQGGQVGFEIPIPATIRNEWPEVMVSFILPSGSKNTRKHFISVARPWVTLNTISNKSFYRIREELSLTSEIEGKAGFVIPLPSLLRVEIPSLNYDATQAVAVKLAEKVQVPVSIPIPEALVAGSYDVRTTLILPNGSWLTKQNQFTIRPADFSMTLEKSVFQAGESIGITITNSGGVDGTVGYRFVLEESRGGKIATAEGQAPILAGGSTTQPLVIPDQAASGEYPLSLTAVDQAEGKGRTFSYLIQITGVTSSLEVKTEKDKYFTIEEIRGTGKIVSGPKDIRDGALDFKVTRLKPGRGLKLYERTGFGSDNDIWNLALDLDGNPVVDAQSGIHRRSGGKWEKLLETDFIGNDIHVDIGGKIWVASYPAGLMVYDGAYWKTYTKADGLAGDYIYSIAEDKDGSNIWLGTNAGLIKFHGSTFTNYTKAEGCLFDYINAVAVDASSAVWIGSDSGAAKFDGTNWTVFTSENSELLDDYIRAIAVDHDGHVWFGSPSGISEYEGTTWKTYREDETGYAGNVFRIAFDADNHLWGVSYNSGLIECDGISWRQFGVSDGLSSANVRDLAVSPEGVVWVATEHGLSRLEDSRWHPVYNDRGIGGLLDSPEGMVIDRSNNKWIATRSGLLRFDGENWTSYLTKGEEVVGSVTSLALGFNDMLWLATDRGLKRFDGVNWTVYPYPEKLQQQEDLIDSMVVGMDGKVWVDNGGGKTGLWAFDGTNWREFSKSDGLPSDSIRRLAIDRQGKIWAWTPPGVGVYDGSTWVTYDTSKGLSSNYISSILADSKGMVWVGTFNGLNRFDGQTWKIFTTADGLPSDIIYSITEDGAGNIWILAYNWDVDAQYLASYDGTSWSSIQLEAVGVDENPYWMFLAVDRSGDIWLISPYPAYLGKYGEVWIDDMAVWSERRSINQSPNSSSETEIAVSRLGEAGKYLLQGALYASTGQKLAASSYPFQLFAEDVSLSLGSDKRYVRRGEDVLVSGEVMNGSVKEETGLTLRVYKKLNNGAEELAFEDSFSLLAKEGRSFSFPLNAADEGKVILRGVVSRLDVTVSSVESGFECVRPVIKAELDAPETVSSEPFNLKIKLSNQGKIEGLIHVAIAPLGYAQDVTLNPSEEKMLLVAAQLRETTEYVFTFSRDLETQLTKTVVYGNTADLEFPASLLFPKGLVDVPVTVRNTGRLDSAFEVVYTLSLATIPDLPLAEHKRTYSLAVGTGFTDSLLFSLSPGDYVLKYASPLAQGQVLIGVVDPGAGRLTLQPQSVYAQGLVTLSFTLLNEAPYAGDIDLTFKLMRGQQEIYAASANYYLNAGETRDEFISFSVEAEGEYTFHAAGAKLTPVLPVNFRVVPLERIESEVTFQAPSGGTLPITVSLRNTGFQDFQGFLAVKSDFYSSQVDVNVARVEILNVDLAMNLDGTIPGEYPVSVVLISKAGKEIPLEIKTVKIEAADIIVSELPSSGSFDAGEQASLTFKLRNQGNIEGEAEFSLKFMDTFDEKRKIVLTPGAEEEVTFTFGILQDLAERDYSAFYKLEGAGVRNVKEGDIRFSVRGIAIDVGAQLDKMSYSEGETARLMLNVSNRNQEPVELFAKVGYLDYEEERSFTLETTASLDFLVPLPRITHEKLFYGIYHRDGRGVYLNDIYIYKREGEIEVLTDRQVYSPGSNVVLSISTSKTGLMRISAPAYEEEFTVLGSISRSFTLPPDLTAGTYAVNWEFTPADGSGAVSSVQFFDVAGLKVVVVEAALSKGKYASGEIVQAKLVLESSQSVAATLKIWVLDPEGGDIEVTSKPVFLSSAEHTIVQESFSFATKYAGMHKVVYGLYGAENQLLVSGSEAFDCGGGVLLGVSTEKRDYPLGTEDVKAYVSFFGDGEAALTLFINDEPGKTMTVALGGVTTEEVVLQAAQLKPGTLTLRAQLQKDNLLSTKETSFNYGSFLPDLTVSGLTYESANLIYTIKAEVMNHGLFQSSAAAVSFYEGNPAEGGTLIQEVVVGALNAGESIQVEIQWSGQGKSGDRDIYAVVDKANAVREFNEGNNETYISLAIPEIFHELRLEKFAYSAYEDLNIVTFIINNKQTAIQGQLDLKLTNFSSMTDVWKYIEAVTNIGSYAQSLVSNIYNLGPSPEGEYRISQKLTIGGKEIVDEATISILKTEKVAGTFTLEPSKVTASEAEEVLVSIELQNRGNVGIKDCALTLRIDKKDTGHKVDEKQIGFALDIAKSTKIQKPVTVNLGEGFYVVKLLFNDEVLDEKELEAKYQAAYTKQESLAPRVLILASPFSVIPDKGRREFEKGKPWKGALDLVLIKQALQEAGVFYKVETNPLSQVQELRSGTYNITILLDINLIFANVAVEIKERVWRGEGVIGILTPSWKKDFIREVFGVETKAWGKEAQKTVETYATPISSEGEFRLQSEFIRIEPKEKSLIIAGKTKQDKEPVITLNHYGEGRAVAFGFRLYASPEEPSFQALKQILLSSFNYLRPLKKKDAVVSRLVPVEMTFQNPGSSVLKLKIEEEIPQEVKLISAEPEPEAKEPLTWTFSLEPSSSIHLRYEVELPDLKGEYQFKTKIVKVEGEEEALIDTPLLSYSVEKTVREPVLETITQIEKLPITSYRDRMRAKMAVMMLTIIQNQNEAAPFAYHKNLLETLIALRELESIETADVALIRKSLIDLMLYYERRTVEAEKKMRLTAIIDLEKLR